MIARRGRAGPLGLIGALFFLWPALHFLACRALEIDPWKLGGWAMYTVPKQHVWVEVLTSDAHGRPVLWATGPGRVEVELFRQRRQALGLLADPEPLARRARAADRTIATVVVRTRLARFDGTTGRFLSRERSYRYER
jgi:hypothetical protein